MMRTTRVLDVVCRTEQGKMGDGVPSTVYSPRTYEIPSAVMGAVTSFDLACSILSDPGVQGRMESNM